MKHLDWQPETVFYHPADQWRATAVPETIKGLARLVRIRRDVAGSLEGHHRGRDEVRDLQWMLDIVNECHGDDDEVLEDVLVRMEASDLPLDEFNAGFLRELIGYYALKYTLRPPGQVRPCQTGCLYPTGHDAPCSTQV